MKCQICEKSGHLAKQCRSQDTDTNVCQLCNKAGHIANRCFKFKLNTDNLSPQIEARSHLNCQLCERSGHTAATCRIRVDKICTYCKNKGHTIEECHKRQYNERMRAGNGQGLPNTSASTEIPQRQVRSTNFLQTEDQVCELLSLD